MRATVFEFRLRFWIIMAIYILGFVAPWDFVLHLDGAGPNGAPGALAGWGGNAHVWGLLAVLLSKGGAMSIAAAFNRSEEHTSELQSLRHLVCRLLLEKIGEPPRSTLFPYTTLFRSGVGTRMCGDCWPCCFRRAAR